MLALLLIFPSSLGKLKFLPIYKAVSIKQNKKLPPHVAFLEINFDARNSEWLQLNKTTTPVVKVGADISMPPGPYVITQKRLLTGIVIRKNPELLVLGSEATYKTDYKTSAQRTEEVQGPQWLKTVVREPATLASKEQKSLPLSAARRISGPIEITGGLAVTNDHHIEVRRANDGVFQEMGRVDLLKGVYSIDVDEPSGSIVARLVNTSGEVLGEGSVRISQPMAAMTGKLISGPRIELSPTISWGGRVSRYYPPPRGRTVEPSTVTTFGGENKVNVAKSGELSFDSLVKNSSTIVRAETKGHWPSNKMLIAGEPQFNIPVFPKSMMSALKNIVNETPSAKSDPDEPEAGAMVWGTAKIDGKPVSGVTIQSESDPGAKAVYFNEFMIPDSKLTATSANGMFAFVEIQEGFQALLGQRGDAYFGHQNVLVEKGTVSVADLESTLRTEAVTVRAFDAFGGEPAEVLAHLQSLPEPEELTGGAAAVILPQVSRLSLLYTENAEPFLKANYFYTDTDTYIHLPLIRDDWLTRIRNEEKVNQVMKTGTIVGFVPGEAFEVYLTGAAKDGAITISYFDATGKATQRGVAGGGFIAFNVPPGFQEAVVVSSKSEKILSKVVPVDENSLSILNFNSY
jgi:hypothetical protein